MNTSFAYLYRDAANFKVFETVVFCGVLRLNDVVPFLYEGEWFIPSQVGLVDLQPSEKSEFDHVWHEIVEVKLSNRKATVPLTSEDLIAAFRAAAEDNWEKAMYATGLQDRLLTEELFSSCDALSSMHRLSSRRLAHILVP